MLIKNNYRVLNENRKKYMEHSLYYEKPVLVVKKSQITVVTIKTKKIIEEHLNLAQVLIVKIKL